ncbi:MAG: ATP-binding cassette domain-containing protein [Methylococcales bacterium]|jgi:ABC transport system ATP-binding/permease protein|nr:ATP-binding cassette domain-containing protein [Methylococcales bacterium]MBT7442436.1 ATP-binding cassette domain-containing protein [Methylococcales bacterium]
MALVRLRDIQLSFGGPLLLDKAQLNIKAGERVCLVGRNGTGKSTLMKLIAQEIKPDSGKIEFQTGLKVARLVQDVPASGDDTVFQVVAKGLGEVGEWLSEFEALTHEMMTNTDDALMTKMSRVQHKIESNDGWSLNTAVTTIIEKLRLSPDVLFSSLSGGVKRRVLLAQALVVDPDILLLDEPTNHLDIESIDWLEQFLLSYQGTVLFVTHDRTFLQKLATRIIELDRGQLTSWECDYETYLVRKVAALEAEATTNAVFDKKLAQEEVWIRQGIKARRTRNEGRVRDLEKMREQRRIRRQTLGTAAIKIEDAAKSGKVVIAAENIRFNYGDRVLVRDFSTVVLRGDKIGIIGPNGVGKTTLIQVLLGNLKPTEGKVELGTQLEVAYFDQLRGQLDEEKSVVDNLAEGRTQIEVNGQSKHVIGYLQDFLFAPERARSPVKSLSGGERNRLLLARLFAKPSNFLILDEPTNDLDVETLELLEERLMQYTGTLMIVSHDRSFLNQVVTNSWAFEGDGVVNQYVGGYDDWLRQKAIDDAKPAPKKAVEPKKAKVKKSTLSFTEAHELKKLPKQIESLEARQAKLHDQVADPAFYQQDVSKTDPVTKALAEVEAELEGVYERWDLLEAKAGE